jgi:branched-chain amino acid transport system substrate-binding protein
MVLRLSVLAGVILGLLLTRPAHGQAAPLQTREVLIGQLDSFTGNGATFGENSKAALEVAIDDINRASVAIGSPFRFRLVTADTQLDPLLALQGLQSLAAQGVRIVIGPETSAELQAVQAYADANNILLLSQGSTAFSLANPGDNTFRFVPNDHHEAIALNSLLQADDVKAMVPIWRGDIGNDDMEQAVTSVFTFTGGTMLQGFRYVPSTVDFTGAVASISDQVSTAIGQFGPNVGVYLAGFDEAASIFQIAESDPVLSSVKWYGSDGTALTEALFTNRTAARFAARVSFSSPLIGLEEELRDRWQPVQDAVAAKIGRIPDAGALAAYDAVHVAALADLITGDTADFNLLKQAFTVLVDSYFGITGPTAVDAAGDRMFADFDFWAIQDDNGVLEWTKVAHYANNLEGTSGSLTRLK